MWKRFGLLFSSWLIAGGSALAQQGTLAPPIATNLVEKDETSSALDDAWVIGSPRPTIWFRADYLMWWVKKGPLSAPLVTFGSDKDNPLQGVIGQPGTSIAFGGTGLDFGMASGLRASGGIALTSDGQLSLEGGWLGLQTRTVVFNAASDSLGNPVIAHPILSAVTGKENSELVSSAFVGVAGATNVTSTSRLQGWEVNLAWNGSPREGLNLSGLVGFRALDLKEDIVITDTFRDVTGFPGAAGLTFLGAPVRTGEPITGVDSFSVRNQFWGPQIGSRLEYRYGLLSMDIFGKVALGWSQQVATIDGVSSAVVNPGEGRTTAPGSVYTQTSNIGRQFHNAFAVVPEVGFNITCQLTSRLTGSVGYSFLYWSNVMRPGDAIDRTVNRFAVPTDQNFGMGTGPARPSFSFQNTDYWAHGVNFTLEYKF